MAIKIKFCPRCNSTDLVMIAGGSLGLWKCKKCRFQGSIFPEKELGEFEEEAGNLEKGKKDNKNKTNSEKEKPEGETGEQEK